MDNRGEGGPDPGPTLEKMAVRLSNMPSEQAGRGERQEQMGGEYPGGQSPMKASGPREQARAKALLAIRSNQGEWSKSQCGYTPQAMGARQCGECLFYHGQKRACHLVEGPVEFGGACNLHVQTGQ